jgi:subtilisin family serine protease
MEAVARRIDDAVKQWPSAAGEAVRQLGADLALRTIAVGSWTAGVRDGFSNCGDWVNGIADGAGAVSQYPSPNGWASWSGTSFATPQVSAALLHGTAPGVVVKDAVGAC